MKERPFAAMVFWSPLVCLIALLVGCDGEPDESEPTPACSESGATWCEGNRLVACRNEDGEVVLHQGVDCSDHDSVCHAWEDSGMKRAACILPDVECDEVGDTVCITHNAIGYCEEIGYYVAYGCAQYWCEESDSGGYASCVWKQGECQDGDEHCFEGVAEAVLECVDGIWSQLDECFDGQECVDPDGESANCVTTADG